MKNNTQLHPLAAPNVQSGRIEFEHSDGTLHTFTSVVNSLSGSRLCYFDNDAPDVDPSLAYVRSVFRDIRNKAKVRSSVGDF